MSLAPAPAAAASQPAAVATATAAEPRGNPFAARYHTRRELDEQSPSLLHPIKPLKPKQLATWRKQYASLIFEVAKLLRLPPQVPCTAALFSHQYYAVRSMQDNDRMLIATAALFLACKVEDHPRSLNDVLRFVFKHKYSKHANVMAVLQNEQQLACLKDTVLKAERAILYTTGFRLKIEHPHAKYVAMAAKFKADELFNSQHSQKRASNILTQAGANFMTDCYQTTLPLRHTPDVIALGALYLAVNICKVKVPDVDGKPWYEAAVPGISKQLLDDFSEEVQRNYHQKEVKPKAAKTAASGAAQQAKAAAASLPQAPGTPSTTAVPVSRKPGGVRESTPDETFAAGGKRSPDWQQSAGAAAVGSPTKRQRLAEPATLAAASQQALSSTAAPSSAVSTANGIPMQAAANGLPSSASAARPADALGSSTIAAPAATGANGHSSVMPAAAAVPLAAPSGLLQPPSNAIPGLGSPGAGPSEPGELPS